MTHIKHPVVAGLFYPGTPQELQHTVDAFMRQAHPPAEQRPRALIAPHAGYRYSGPIAASAYATLRPWADAIRRVVVLAPSHRVPFRGLATSSAEAFQTPLGDIPVDRAAVDALEQLPGVQQLDAAFAQEHALEVQLPFLQTVLNKNFGLIPLVVGDAEPEAVAEVIELLWGGPETLVLISSDLSHYHDYDTARRLDSATSHAIEQLNPQAIDYQQACGRTPVNGLLLAAREGAFASTVEAIELAIANLKEQMETEDAGKIRSGIQNVTEAAMKLGEAIYKAEQEKAAGEPSEEDDEPRGVDDDIVWKVQLGQRGIDAVQVKGHLTEPDDVGAQALVAAEREAAIDQIQVAPAVLQIRLQAVPEVDQPPDRVLELLELAAIGWLETGQAQHLLETMDCLRQQRLMSVLTGAPDAECPGLETVAGIVARKLESPAD